MFRKLWAAFLPVLMIGVFPSTALADTIAREVESVGSIRFMLNVDDPSTASTFWVDVSSYEEGVFSTTRTLTLNVNNQGIFRADIGENKRVPYRITLYEDTPTSKGIVRDSWRRATLDGSDLILRNDLAETKTDKQFLNQAANTMGLNAAQKQVLLDVIELAGRYKNNAMLQSVSEEKSDEATLNDTIP